MSVISPPDEVEKTVVPKRERPIITETEDRPLDENFNGAENGGPPLIKRIEEKEQEHKHKVEDYKNIVGGILLTVCFLIIIGFSAADAYFKIESVLFSGAFEFAKTIATAVIGYLFAANTKKE